MAKWINKLYYGDNLEVLRLHLADESVDLVYLDPPFNSNANYNVLFAEEDGSRAAAQIEAFGDTWRWDQASAAAFQEVVELGGEVSKTMVAFQNLLGDSNMLAYLAMMAPRLIELRRVLKPEGSIYLHCDPTASHYLKLLMDSVFGASNFVNEIIWRRYGSHNDAGQGSTHYGRVHDVLLFYSGSDSFYWQQQYSPLDQEAIERDYRHEEPETGRRYTTKPLTAPGGAAKGNPSYEWNGHTRFWRYSQETMQELHDAGKLHYSKTGYVRQKHYLDESEGVPAQDIWVDIKPLTGKNAERLGYPTQKPEALLDRIIKSSCPEGGLVLDPFCGCGTTVVAAEKLERRWIGIDITYLAVALMKSRLADLQSQSDGVNYEVIGEPIALKDAKQLAKDDPYQFQWWALGLVGARPTEQKKGADQGIDGRIYFFDEGNKTKQVIISIKAGKVTVSHIRDLLGVLDRENAQIGVLISMNEPTGPMRKEAASAGFYSSPLAGEKFPRIQLLTIEDLLGDKKIERPYFAGTGSMIVAPESAPKVDAGQMTLGEDSGPSPDPLPLPIEGTLDAELHDPEK